MGKTKLLQHKARRYGSCDLLRFIFSLFIVGNHIYQIGVPGEPFAAARIFVEFFFMISGFFMIQKFENKQQKITNDLSAKEALLYTWNKYKSLMYYVIPCILLEYIIRIVSSLLSSSSITQIGRLLLNLPLELVMVAPLTDNRCLVPIWYISAMLIAMPLLCFVYLRFRSAFVYILSWLIPVVYLFVQGGVSVYSGGIGAVCRAYCDMSLGCFIYFVSGYISRINISKLLRCLLSIAEIFCFAVPIVLVSMKNENRYNVITLLFVIGIVIMMSGSSYSIKLKGGLFSYLGKISLPIYTIHWCIGSVVWLIYSIFDSIGFNISLTARVVIYYSFTVIASMIFCFIVDKIKGKKKSA